MTNCLSLELINQIQEITRLGDAVGAFCEANACSPTLVFELNLVLDEIMTNIISYGFPDSAGLYPSMPSIKVEIRLEGNRLIVIISDNGIAFNPLKHEFLDQTDVKLEDRKIGGLGIHLVTHYMDEVAYERIEQYNVLTLSRKLS